MGTKTKYERWVAETLKTGAEVVAPWVATKIRGLVVRPIGIAGIATGLVAWTGVVNVNGQVSVSVVPPAGPAVEITIGKPLHKAQPVVAVAKDISKT